MQGLFDDHGRPTVPTVTAVSVPFAALVLQKLEQSGRRSGIVVQGAHSFLSVREVAVRLGMCKATINRLVADGKLPSVRVGNVIRIPSSRLAGFQTQF
jgi:excisionase family DNA binding protein